MANEFIIKNGYFSQGSSNVTGSLTVTAGVTASLQGTASWSNNAITASYIVTAQTASYVLNSVSSSFATTSQTASFVTLAQTASFVTTAQTASYVLNAVSSSFSSTAQNANTASFVTLAQTASFVTTAQTASYVLNAVSASRATSASRADSAVTASYVLNAVSASFASTTSFVNTLNQNVTVSGSLTVTNDFIVQGSASIVYITSSQLNIADNIISVNTVQPSVRFGGLSVIDSGSTPQVSGSMLFDSQNNQWIFVHQSAAAAAVTSSVVLMGPQTFNNVGSETQLTTNRIPKAAGVDLGEHLNDSNITDTGVFVSINSNTQITGSLTLGGGATGSLQGTASFATTASFITLAQTASFATTAQTASYVLNAVSASFASTASYILNAVSASFITLAQTASFVTTAQTASYVLNAVSASFASTASFVANAFIQNGNSFGTTATLGTNDAQNLILETNNTTRLFVSSSGNVGIGTTTPKDQLTITGNTVGSGIRLESGIAGIEASTIRETSFHSTLYLASNLYYSGSTAPEANSYYISDTGSNNRGGNLFYIKSNAGGSNPSSGFYFYTAPTSSGTDTLATLTENFRIIPGTASFSNNNVGIGITAPTAKLHVTNTGTDNSFLVEDSGNIDATPFVIDAAGNVGIGTGSAFEKVTIQNGNIALKDSTNSAQTSIVFTPSDNTLRNYITTANSSSALDDYMKVGSWFGSVHLVTGNITGSTTRLYVSRSGEIGVGISSSLNARFHINNTTTQNSFLVEDSTNPDATPFVIDASGNVGIGTTTPTQGTLQVAGNVFATSFTGSITGSITGTLTGTASFATSASFLTSNTNAFIQGGNSFGATATLGTNDTQNLSLETAGIGRLTISGSGGEVGIGQAPTTGFQVAANGTIGSFAPAGSPTGSLYIDHTGVQGWKIGVSASNTSTLSIGNDLGGAFANKPFNITNAGNVGIGTTTPNARLDVNGNAIITGSLSITSGSQTIRFISGSNTSGYTVSVGINDDGVNIANNSPIRGFNFSNINGRIITMASILYNSTFSNYVGIGIPSSSSLDSSNPEQLLVSGSTINNIVGKTNINNYTQLNIVNTNSGTAASADVVATNNTGNESGNFIDMGINGSGYTGGIVGVANEAYLYNTGSQLWIGNATPGSSGNVNIFAGNLGTSTAIFISSSQRVSINKITPNATFDVNGNAIITGSLSVTSVSNSTGSFVTIDANNTLNSRTAAQTRVDINYYGLTYAMQNGYY